MGKEENDIFGGGSMWEKGENDIFGGGSMWEKGENDIRKAEMLTN